MAEGIDRLIEYAKIDVAYTDAFGVATTASDDVRLEMLRALGFDVSDDAGAERELARLRELDRARALEPVYVVREGDSARLPAPVLSVTGPRLACGYYGVETPRGRTRIIVTPSQAHVPAGLDRDRVWGIAAQLYSVRSASNWGIGDFGDLARLGEAAARSGASTLALNPLHQSHLTNPASASPYAPLSRRYVNALYIDVVAAARRCNVALDLPNVEALRDATFIDYRGVARTKLRALEAIFEAWTERAAMEPFAQADPGLRAMALYEAIMEATCANDASVYGWQQWPAELRDRFGPAVAAFEASHQERLTFFIFLQWLADEQLAGAAQAVSAMSIGLYRDLAVGVDLASVDVWCDPQAFALGLSVGAPPDPLNRDGQNWGLPPFHPRVLRERGYEPLVTLLRANMRHAGALRIDHVMGLRRLFCMPRALPRAGGAYVNYDFEAMLGIVALESRRNGCMVVGEDLGTVPEGFRERLGSARIFMCRVLFFEREWDGRFRDPQDYPAGSVASTGTHDLPTLPGLWTERGPGDTSATPATRERLIEALLAAGLLDPADGERLRAQGADPSPDALTALLVAAYRYLGRARSDVVLVQLEDALLQREQVNVPGTVDQEPNWQRRLPIPLEAIEQHPVFAAIARALRDERPLTRLY